MAYCTFPTSSSTDGLATAIMPNSVSLLSNKEGIMEKVTRNKLASSQPREYGDQYAQHYKREADDDENA